MISPETNGRRVEGFFLTAMRDRANEIDRGLDSLDTRRIPISPIQLPAVKIKFDHDGEKLR